MSSLVQCFQSSVSGGGPKSSCLVHVEIKVQVSVSVMVHVLNDGGVVALKQRLHEEANGPDHTHQHKDPQEKTVDHHGHVLPVLNDLQRGRIRYIMSIISRLN